MSGIVDLYYFIFRNGIAKNGIENRIRPNFDVSIASCKCTWFISFLITFQFSEPIAIAKTIGQYMIFNSYITSICLMVLILHKSCYSIKQKLKQVLQQQQKKTNSTTGTCLWKKQLLCLNISIKVKKIRVVPVTLTTNIYYRQDVKVSLKQNH